MRGFDTPQNLKGPPGNNPAVILPRDYYGNGFGYVPVRIRSHRAHPNRSQANSQFPIPSE